MDKKRTIFQNIIFMVLSVIIFLASFITVLNMNENSTAVTLESYSKQVSSELISERNADDVIIEFSLIDDLRVSIYEKNNDFPIADTRPFPQVEGGFAEITNNIDKTYFSYSDTIGTEMMYHVIYDTDSELYIRVGFPRSQAQKASTYTLYFALMGFSLLDILFIAYSFFNFKKSIEPLKLATVRLQGIVNKKPDNKKKEDDIKVLSDSIDEVGIEFKRQLEESIESKQKLHFIINSLSQGIMVVDGDLRIILINDSAENLLSVDKSKIINAKIDELNFNPKVCESIVNTVKKASFPHFDQNIDGKDYMFDFETINYPWTKGKYHNGCLVFIYDITSQKRADEIQKEFFANTSHELKSPLTSILGYQELIKEGIISSKKDLDDANTRTLEEAQRMREIVKYMLENSTMVNAISVSDHDVSKYVNTILDSLSYELKQKKIKVKKHLDKIIFRINHDDLDKLIRNLLINAIKYNKVNGSIEITVDKKEKTLCIKDTGIGINAKDLPLIFDRFYMADKGRSRDNYSSGIGLSIVKRVVDYYKFRIDVESKVGEGSSFTIHF